MKHPRNTGNMRFNPMIWWSPVNCTIHCSRGTVNCQIAKVRLLVYCQKHGHVLKKTTEYYGLHSESCNICVVIFHVPDTHHVPHNFISFLHPAQGSQQGQYQVNNAQSWHHVEEQISNKSWWYVTSSGTDRSEGARLSWHETISNIHIDHWRLFIKHSDWVWL